MHLSIFLAALPLVPGGLSQKQTTPETAQRDYEARAAKYVVKIKSDQNDTLNQIISSISVKPDYTYRHAFTGFAGPLTDEEKTKLKSDPRVADVEDDGYIRQPVDEATSTKEPINVQDDELDYTLVGYEPRIIERGTAEGYVKKEDIEGPEGQRSELKALWYYLFPKSKPGVMITEKKHVPWNLARISNLKANHTWYTYDERAGSGTCVYVLDSGLDDKLDEFKGRAEMIEHFWNDGGNRSHGTFVSGIIGSKTYGVAKNTTLLGMQVVNREGGGSKARVINAMDFVIGDAPTRHEQCPKGVAVYIPLTGSYSPLVNEGARKVVNSGYFLVVSAGNGGQDAAKKSPASEPLACTVGATTRGDAIAEFSNWGSSIDVLAPGTGIRSVVPGGRAETHRGDVSYAGAHVAGLGAYFMGMGRSADGLCDFIKSEATSNILELGPYPKNLTPNRLINNGFR
ncbi:hypothetical protein QQS21_005705 [Conoideocrella luteorostrata]|uniref:Uncharacterized protein n=1 Tax=Conoideocrella luteorostrata TaxID=1105319 RepID=A0AAJ0CNX0_9HYPO|nr:hypothetical protein QQS21_005705 [Conoideocrella luteorostrata]